MGIKEMLGLGKKVRYGFVALGDITQEAMLPGVTNTGNSRATALVSSDLDKARAVAEKYDIESLYTYDQFGQMLRDDVVDAIYLATPNWRHAEFILPALEAGVHVLAEKPLEIDVARCRQVMEAAKTSKAKLMVAYRLHFEPATLALIERIRSGELGQVHLFSSTFAQMLDPKNHRATSGDLAGPLLDMGPYPINASRYVFEDEPEEVVSAIATRHPDSDLGDIDDTVAVTLRFPGNRLAQFIVSYFANQIDGFTVVGTKGSIRLTPSYFYGKPLVHHSVVGKYEDTREFKNTDHFGGEMKYFSDCILNDVQPEPDAEEGLADIRVVEGIFEAIKTGSSVKLPPFSRTKRIDPKMQEQTLRAVRPPELVGAENPARDVHAAPKN